MCAPPTMKIRTLTWLGNVLRRPRASPGSVGCIYLSLWSPLTCSPSDFSHVSHALDIFLRGEAGFFIECSSVRVCLMFSEDHVQLPSFWQSYHNSNAGSTPSQLVPLLVRLSYRSAN